MLATFRRLTAVVLLSAAAAGATACVGGIGASPDPDPGDDAGTGPITDDQEAIDEYIDGIDELPAPPPNKVEGERSAPEREGDYRCVTQDMEETRRYDSIVAYASNSDSMWPGAILRGDSVYSGLFTQTVFARTPLTVSVSLSSLSGMKSATMQQPSLSAFRDTIGNILDSDVDGATPANIYSEIESVHSEEQLSLAMGAEASWLGSAASIKASFDFDQQDIRSRFVVRYTQAYYTVDADAPSSASAWLAPSVTFEEVESKFGTDNPPVYVSSVTYGRMVVFTFESEYSSEEMAAALEFAYSAGVDVSGDVSVTYKEMLSRSRITAYILGGSGGEAARTIDSYDALIDFIKSGGDYSKDSPGAPIAYKLNYLRDNAPARMSFTTDYQVKECERVSQKVKVTLEYVQVDSDGGDAGGDLELYGQVWVDAVTGETLLDKDPSTYVVVDEGMSWPQSGIIAEAVVDVVPQPGNEITLGADLSDYDPTSSDDWLGYETFYATFEIGWRRDVSLLLTGDDAVVEVVLHLEPI
jgi:thiol-activated cytolysin